MHFTFGSPYLLAIFLLLPCFLWCARYTKPFYFSKLSWVPQQSLLSSWELWLKIFIFSLMVLAMAQPFTYDAKTSQQKKGRDLILSLDASGSMAQRGFDKKNRMETKYAITLALSNSFLDKRYDDNIGVVLFGTFAYTASPLTYDLQALKYLLNMTNVGLAGKSTAIGDAIMQSLHTLSYGDAKNKAIILLSDGFHNAGNTSPKHAVEKAKKSGVKVYTIGIGKKSNYDVTLLEAIAKETGAHSYAASTAEELEAIFQNIDTLEPSPIRSENYLNQKLLTHWLLGIAFSVLLLWQFWHMNHTLTGRTQ